MNDQAPVSDWVTSGEACRILGVSRQRLHVTVRSRGIPFLRLYHHGFLYWRKAIEEELERLEDIRAKRSSRSKKVREKPLTGPSVFGKMK